MERLYAPWRMAYVDQSPSPEVKGNGCVFCDKASSHDDEANFVIARGQDFFVLLNIFPYNNGHLLITPYRHTAVLADLTPEMLTEMMTLTQMAQTALATAFHPDGYNLGMNMGTAGGAGIADHLHLHLVPRWNGDTNFMPVLGDVKVLPDSLEESARKIRAAWPHS